MAGNVKGITISFGANTTELDQALRRIKQSTKDIDTELKQVDNALKFNPTNVDLWRQKQELLRAKIAQTKDNLDELKKRQADLDAKGVDKNSEEYRKLQREIITTESKLKSFETQLRKIGNANLKALSEQLKKIGDKMTEVGRTMTTKVTAPIAAGYAAAAKYASDYEENLNKLDVAFGSNSETVKKWANNAGKQFGLSKVQATNAASAFGALGKGIGLSEKEAADMSTTLAGLSADLGSYFNVGTDESAKALEGIFTGEAEALKKFGVVMTETNLKKFAEDMGLVYDEMTQAEKTQLRYNYVLAKTKDAQGDFARTSDGTANSIKIFKSTLQDLATAIGTNLLPIITPVIQKITQLLNKFNTLSPRTQKIVTVVGLVVAAVGPLLVVLGTLISSIGAVIGVLGMVTAPMIAVVAAIGLVIAAGILLYKNWDTIKEKAIALFNQLKTTFNNIKTTITNAWNNIKTNVSNAVDAIKTKITNTFNTVKSTITNTFNSIKTTATTVWNNIKSAISTAITDAKDKVKTTVSAVKDTLSSAWSSIKDKASSAWSSIKDKITGPFESAKEKISGIVSKIKGWFPISIGNIFKGLKTPHFSLNWSSKDFGKLGTISYPTGLGVSWYKTGGIFDSPSIIGVGEAGAEAVVPLDKLWDKLDNIQGETNIVINVNGANKDPREIAEEVKRVLIKETNQRRLAWQ